MNNYVFEGDIDYQQVDFILRKFWENGSIAGFKLPMSEGSKDHPQGLAVFTPFAPNGWNIYDWPISVNLINTRGVRFIPTGVQQVDKDVVIGYIQRNKKGVGFFVDSIVQDIVVIDMVIRINLNAHKMPYLVVVDPLSEKKMKALYDKIKDDDPELFISSDEANNFKALVSGAPFILDKLYNLKQAKENERQHHHKRNEHREQQLIQACAQAAGAGEAFVEGNGENLVIKEDESGGNQKRKCGAKPNLGF